MIRFIIGWAVAKVENFRWESLGPNPWLWANVKLILCWTTQCLSDCMSTIFCTVGVAYIPLKAFALLFPCVFRTFEVGKRSELWFGGEGTSHCTVTTDVGYTQLQDNLWTEWCHISWSAWFSSRTSVSGQRSFAVLRSTRSWWVTAYVGKPSAIGQPTRPTQPFILSGSINE